VIKTVPESARILVNNSEVGTSPVTNKLTFANKNTVFDVVAQRTGYQDGSIKIDFDAASTREHVIRLGRAQKTVRVQSEPVGATVFVNGQPAGITPLTKDLVFEDPNKPFELTLRKDGFKDALTNLAYAPLSQTEYKVTLAKVEAIPMELISVEPQHTDTGVKLVLTRKPTLAYLEVIERSPNVASVTRVTVNEDKALNVGAPVLSPASDVLLFTEIVEEENKAWYSNIEKQRVGELGKTRLTYGKWHDLFPAFTPDGKKAVFSSNRTSSNPTLWQVGVDAQIGLTKLTYTQAEDYSPTVAPGDKMVVFTSNPPGADEPQIWIFSRESNLLTQLREGEVPQVSPDGKHILFIRQDKLSKRHQLWVMSSDGAEETQLSQNTDYDITDPRWSPDGKWIVYASNEGFDSQKLRNYDIWIMSANGSKRTQLTTNGSQDDSPCWDFQGKTIYFRSNRGGAWNIWRFQPILSAE
jgi:Tol biopolymer transport system component